MKRIYQILSFVAVVSIYSCDQDLTVYETQIQSNNCSAEFSYVQGVSFSRLKFASKADIVAQINQLKDSKQTILPKSATTRSVDGEEDTTFVSLRESLAAQGIVGLSNEELAVVAAEELEYEPEDSIVWDPYMCAVLNSNREVQVEDSIYRIVENGYVIYDANEDVTYIENVLETVDTTGMTVNSETLLADGIVFGYFPIRTIYRDNLVPIPNPDPIIGLPPSTDDNEEEDDADVPEEVYYADYPHHMAKSALTTSGGLTLLDNIGIPKEDIVSCIYKDKAHESAGFLSRVFGHSTVISNYFDSNHRMRLRMYSQNYGIWVASGMTVRMQKKFAGTWWRKKADEFRYGWSGIELVTTYATKPFANFQEMPQCYSAQFKCEDKPILFFKLDPQKYDFENGYTTLLYSQYINNNLQSKIRKWEAEASSAERAKYYNEYGVVTINKDNDKKYHYLLPQGEDTATNQGREVYHFDLQILPYGIFTYFSLGNGQGYQNFTKMMPNVSITTLDRGLVYAGVKFNGQWKGAYISTGE